MSAQVRTILIAMAACGIFFLESATADDRHLQSFDLVWRTVNEAHYDPGFGGLDWRALGDRYRPQAAAATGLAEFSRIANRMLFELKLSHLLVCSTADLQWYLPTVMSPGSVGITVRLVDGCCVIASVENGSPAARAGLLPGLVITAVDNRPVTDLLETAGRLLPPPFNPRNRENTLTRFLLGQIQGEAGTAVHLSWEDQNGMPRETAVTRTSTGPGVRLVDFLPPYHLTFAYRQLAEDIGYVRFNHFASPIDHQLATALETLPPDAGLVIDLRGTPGGYLRSLDTVAGMLLDPSVVLYRLQMRGQEHSRMPVPAERVHRGPVAVIVDALSMSASEILAACLQELGRAVIVGSRSPGYVLTANWTGLPNGAFLMYTIGRNTTPNGSYLEDTGVTPDIEVPLDRAALLAGRDVQLEAAVAHLRARLARGVP